MPKMWISTPRMTDGVSQQPDSRRFRSQAKEIVNSWLSTVDGADKRPGTRHITEIHTSNLTHNYWSHWADIKAERSDIDPVLTTTIVAQPAQQYLFLGTSPQSGGLGMLRCWDLAGTEIHVEDSASASAGGTLGGATPGWDYLSGLTVSARENLKMLTIADTTIVANRTVTPAMDAALSTAATANGEGYVSVKVGNYDIDYTIKITENTGSPTTHTHTVRTFKGTGTTPANVLDSLSTNDIAQNFVEFINGTSGAAPSNMTAASTAYAGITGVTAEVVDSVVRITGSSGHEIVAIEAGDGVGDTSIEVLFETVDTFVDLPLTCKDGFKIRVTGDPTIGGDDYIIKFVADDPVNSYSTPSTIAGFGSGVWVEDIDYGIKYKFDDTTMPHKLTRKVSDGSTLGSGYTPTNGQIYFDFEKITWGDRVTGDETLVPDPSFIGRQIDDVFLFKNRLGFLSDDKVNLSKTNQFFDFWRTTLQSLLDSDPIDVANAHTGVAYTTMAQPFESDLLLFSRSDQFRIPGGELLTPKTVGIRPVGHFRTDDYVRVEPSGTGLWFAQRNGKHTQLLELYRRGDSGLFDAAELSEQARRYIPGAVREMSGSTEAECLALILDDPATADRSVLYLYQYHWSGRERVQSAWHKWDFGEDNNVRSIKFFDNVLYILIDRDSGLFLEKIDMSDRSLDEASDGSEQNFNVKMDRKYAKLSGITYDAQTQLSTLNLDWDLGANETVQVVTFSNATPSQVMVNVVETNRTTPGSHYVTLTGDWSSTKVWVGTRYDQEYHFGSIMVKRTSSASGGESVVTEGNTQVLQGRVVFGESGPFQIEVTPRGGSTYTYQWTGRAVGDIVLGEFTGKQNLDDGEIPFPVMAEARDVDIVIRNWLPYPSPLQTAEWLLHQHMPFRRLG